MDRKKLKKLLSTVLAFSVLMSGLSVGVSADKISQTELEYAYGTPIDFDYNSDNTYDNFKQRYETAPSPAANIVINADSAAEKSSENFSVVNYEGRENVLLFPQGSDEWAKWSFTVPESGLYNISYDVNLGENAGNELDISLRVNDEIQFNESQNNVVRRVWYDTTEILKDSRDNDLRPKMAQKPVWTTHKLSDPEGYNEGNLKIYLNAGENTVSLSSQGQQFYISNINIYQEKELIPYSELKAEYEQKGYKKANSTIKIQAEKPFLKNSSTIYPVADKTSPMTEPSSSYKIRLNSVGGKGWQSVNQNITWEFDVEEAGLYNISLKYLQNITSGMFTTRRIYIDSEVPCKELDNINFAFNDNWQMNTLSNDDGAMEFYFDKGKHYITMEVTFGDITDILRNTNECIYTMNEYYRKIIMISGSSPDLLRDYQFEKQIPDLIETFEKLAEDLDAQKQALISLSGGKSGSAVSQLDKIIYDLSSMAKEPEKISSRLSVFKSNISGLSAWVLNMANQPLQLDYILLKAPDEAEPEIDPGFFQTLKYGLDTFIASFTEDYDLISDDSGGEGKKSVRVWVNLGRDQVGILKDLIVDKFSPETNINVQLELVQGALIEATLAGRGPDVALTLGSTLPVNYAIRGALTDLSQFDDFDEITERFHPSSMVPFKFNGGYYALPDTQNYEMMFYRKDILSELGVGIPNTWEQFKQIIPVVKKNNMDIGWSAISDVVPNDAGTAFTIFNTLMYQRGGQYYSDDLKSTALGSEEAREAFKEATSYYINYKFPDKYDFYSRFRTGDMPLAIQLYTQANQLRVGAPEIKGLWGMAPLPGMVQEDGTLNRSQTSAVTANVMFDAAKDKESAWEFMKWYTSADIQAEYGIELEKVMGAAARYATANREAFTKIPWTLEEQNMLNSQWDDVKGVPEVPGSYYTPRGIQNAFRTTIYSYSNPYETLHESQLDIDEEIARKYKEFGLE